MWKKRLFKKRKAFVIIVGVFLLFFWLIPLPKPLFDAPYTTTLWSRNGQLLSAAIASDHQWRFAPADTIPEKFKTALRLFEDEYFYYHLGINPVSLVRATYQNINKGKIVSGGSTLSMQTVRMAFGNQPRTYLQKIIELASAVKMELLYSKEEILLAHANHAPFGGNIVGLNAASWRYYGRPPSLLSWAEITTLAILPNNPSAIFPGKNQEALLIKRNLLLEKIHSHGFLSEDDLLLAQAEPLPQKTKNLPDHAYHLLHRAMAEGQTGKNVVATLDASLQVRAARLVHRYSQEQAANEVHNAAAIILDIRSGNVLAYIGNSNNKGIHGQHVDIITARRSPGSLLKPFLYAMSLDAALIYPNQLLPDIPIFYNGFTPKNFDKKYRGAVHADQALSSSLNVPFVHLLTEYGYEQFHQNMKAIGFDSFDQAAGHYGLSIVLGGAESTLWEMSAAYSGMARAYLHFLSRPIAAGYAKADYHENRFLLTEKDESEPETQPDGYLKVPSIGFTFEALQALQRPDEEDGWEQFASSQEIAWKTGTSFGFRDAWAIGLNDQYLVGVWLGNADGEGRPGLTGVKAAAPLLFELFSLLGGHSILQERFGTPQNICRSSGMLASNICPETTSTPIPDYLLQNQNCTLHKIIQLDSDRRFQVNSNCYPLGKMVSTSWFALPPVQSWYYQMYHPQYKPLPAFRSNCETKDGKALFALIYPNQYSRVQIPLEQDGLPGQTIFEATHEDPQAQLHWHLDRAYLGTTQRQHQMGISTEKGAHTITLVDDQGQEIKQRFEVVE